MSQPAITTFAPWVKHLRGKQQPLTVAKIVLLRETARLSGGWDLQGWPVCLAAAVLPPLDKLERILRYETKLERQQQRAMLQLERLQRMRQGEAVPAPLSVEVSERERE